MTATAIQTKPQPLLAPVGGVALEILADGSLMTLQRYRLLGSGLAVLEPDEFVLATNPGARVRPAENRKVELPAGTIVDHSPKGLRLSQDLEGEIDAREVRFIDREECVRFLGRLPVALARGTLVFSLERKPAETRESVAA
jgi:hypothetical protein